MRDGKQLLLYSRKFARERRLANWWCILSSLGDFVGLQAAILTTEPVLLRLAASTLAGLTIIRLFVIHHDYEHGTILKRSPVAWVFMKTWGVLTLNAPSIWRRSHDHHHKHNAKLYGSSIGSYPQHRGAQEPLTSVSSRSISKLRILPSEGAPFSAIYFSCRSLSFRSFRFAPPLGQG